MYPRTSGRHSASCTQAPGNRPGVRPRPPASNLIMTVRRARGASGCRPARPGDVSVIRASARPGRAWPPFRLSNDLVTRRQVSVVIGPTMRSIAGRGPASQTPGSPPTRSSTSWGAPPLVVRRADPSTRSVPRGVAALPSQVSRWGSSSAALRATLGRCLPWRAAPGWKSRLSSTLHTHAPRARIRARDCRHPRASSDAGGLVSHGLASARACFAPCHAARSWAAVSPPCRRGPGGSASAVPPEPQGRRPLAPVARPFTRAPGGPGQVMLGSFPFAIATRAARVSPRAGFRAPRGGMGRASGRCRGDARFP